MHVCTTHNPCMHIHWTEVLTTVSLTASGLDKSQPTVAFALWQLLFLCLIAQVIDSNFSSKTKKQEHYELRDLKKCPIHVHKRKSTDMAVPVIFIVIIHKGALLVPLNICWGWLDFVAINSVITAKKYSVYWLHKMIYRIYCKVRGNNLC